MVYYRCWNLWQISPFTSHISTSSLSLWIGLFRSIFGTLTSSLKEATSLILRINMGRTFRREKTYGEPRRKLNTHRDLPDNQDDLLDEYDDYDEEELFYGKLYSEEQNVVGSQDEPIGKRNKR